MTHIKSHNEQTRRLRVSLPVPDECAVWTHTKCMNGHASHIIRRKTSESIRISKRDPVQQVQQLCSHATSRGVWIIGTIGNNQETDHKNFPYIFRRPTQRNHTSWCTCFYLLPLPFYLIHCLSPFLL